MPAGYSQRFTEEDFEEFKAVARRLGERGRFNANDFLGEILEQRLPTATPLPKLPGALDPNVNAGDAAQILHDLADLGLLRRIEGSQLSGDLPEWELA